MPVISTEAKRSGETCNLRCRLLSAECAIFAAASPRLSEIEQEKRHMTKLSRKGVLFLALCITFTALSTKAEQIKIRVVDGHNGRPIKAEHVSVAVLGQKGALDYVTDVNGFITIELAPSAEFLPSTGWRVVCRTPNPMSPHWFSAATVANHGAVDQNTCGKAPAEQIKGTLTIFTRKSTFFEDMAR